MPNIFLGLPKNLPMFYINFLETNLMDLLNLIFCVFLKIIKDYLQSKHEHKAHFRG